MSIEYKKNTLRGAGRVVVEVFIFGVLLFVNFATAAGSCGNGTYEILPLMFFDMECTESYLCFQNKVQAPNGVNYHLSKRSIFKSGPQSVAVVNPMEQERGRVVEFTNFNRGFLTTHFGEFPATQSTGFTVSVWFKYSQATDRDGSFFTIGGFDGFGYSLQISRHESTENVKYAIWDGWRNEKVYTSPAAYDVWHSTSFSIARDFCWHITLDTAKICNCCRSIHANFWIQNSAVENNRNHANIFIGYHSAAAMMTGFVDDVRVFNQDIHAYDTDASMRVCLPCPSQYSATALTKAHATQLAPQCIQFV